MDYIKFNCYDLASQNDELLIASKRLQSLCDELEFILAKLEPQVKNYEAIRNTVNTSKEKALEVVDKIDYENFALDKVIDHYYVAERKVMELSRDLPINIDKFAGTNKSGIYANSGVISKISISTVNNKNLVLEDWLMELVYKSENVDR